MQQHDSSHEFEGASSIRRGRLARQIFDHTDQDQKTLLNQECSPLLKIPAELRNMINEFTFSNTVYVQADSLVFIPKSGRWETMKRVREPSFATRSQQNYRGAFALSYTCRQIHQEAPWAFIAKYLLFDLTDNWNISRAAGQFGASTTHVRAIRITDDEASRITGWFLKGAINSNGDSNHYAMNSFPSLSTIEIAVGRQPLHHSLADTQKAFQFCFNIESLKISVERSEEDISAGH